MRLKVQFGEPAMPDEAGYEMQASFASLKDVCTVDAERDAFVAMRLSGQNLTEGFSINPTLEILNPGVSELSELETATEFSDGPSCTRQAVGNSGGSVHWLGLKMSLEPDEPFQKDVLVVLHDFRGPGAPDGDPEGFGRAVGTMNVVEGAEERYEPTCVDTDMSHVWTGAWGGMVLRRPLFSVLDVASAEIPVADESLPGC